MKLTRAFRTSIRSELTALLAQATQRLSPAQKADSAIIAARDRARAAKAAVSAKRPTHEVTQAEWEDAAAALAQLKGALAEVAAQRKAGRPPIGDAPMIANTVTLTAAQWAWLERESSGQGVSAALRTLVNLAMR